MNTAFDKMSVLAVDDNRTNLHILQVFLKKLGHDVLLAENGEQAVQRFLEHQPDLVLLDIMMPVMDGFEAARRIKAACRDKWVPIIFLSALNRDENLVEGLEAGERVVLEGIDRLDEGKKAEIVADDSAAPATGAPAG